MMHLLCTLRGSADQVVLDLTDEDYANMLRVVDAGFPTVVQDAFTQRNFGITLVWGAEGREYTAQELP